MDVFGITQEEVSENLRDCGLSDMENQVREWYGGFTFGNRTDIYNPWSIMSTQNGGFYLQAVI